MISIWKTVAFSVFSVLVLAGVAGSQEVQLGIDILRDNDFQQLSGRRVGLITNHTGRDSRGRSTVELLAEAKGVDLRVLFSPEHGFEGKLDISKIDDARDESTGLRIYSLYGETRRPTREMLEGIDTIVFDIQDIGCRFYTYVSTMGEAMSAAAEFGISFVVLDRPNPINGVDIAGPMLDAGYESFVGYHSLPVRHGMTAGELAMMFQSERKLNLDLTVIQCDSWNREGYWEATGLTWVNPSPNMRSLAEAVLYPGVGLLEMTNLSVGRGSDTPFEWIGAPWIQHRELAKLLNAMRLPGVIFIPVETTPDSSKYANELCYGVNISVVNRSQFEPIRCGLALAVALQQLHPDKWETKNLNRLMGNRALSGAILEGKTLEELVEMSQQGVDEFRVRRERFLIY